jgi:hypothetical protein
MLSPNQQQLFLSPLGGLNLTGRSPGRHWRRGIGRDNAGGATNGNANPNNNTPNKTAGVEAGGSGSNTNSTSMLGHTNSMNNLLMHNNSNSQVLADSSGSSNAQGQNQRLNHHQHQSLTHRDVHSNNQQPHNQLNSISSISGSPFNMNELRSIIEKLCCSMTEPMFYDTLSVITDI